MVRRAAAEEDDRRLDRRVRVEIWMVEEHGTERVFRRAANISAGGAYLDHGLPRPVGTRVRLRFRLPGNRRLIEVTGEVIAYETHGRQIGTRLRFIDLSGDDHILLSAFAENQPKKPVSLEDEITVPTPPRRR